MRVMTLPQDGIASSSSASSRRYLYMLGMLALTVLAVLVAISLGSSGGATTEIEKLFEVMTPAGSENVKTLASVRSEFAVAMTREFSTDQSWSQYLGWLRARLPSEFALAEEGAMSIAYNGSILGDHVVLRMERVTPEPQLRVRVTARFVAG